MALTNKLTAIADAIRAKTGTTDEMTLDAMASAIASITTGSGESGGAGELEVIDITIDASYALSISYDLTEYIEHNFIIISYNLYSSTKYYSAFMYNAEDGTNSAIAGLSNPLTRSSASKYYPTAKLTDGILTYTAVGTNYCPDNVKIYTVVDDGSGGGITPTGEISITENGTYDVTEYASAVVNVAATGGGGLINNLNKTPATELDDGTKTYDLSVTNGNFTVWLGVTNTDYPTQVFLFNNGSLVRMNNFDGVRIWGLYEGADNLQVSYADGILTVKPATGGTAMSGRNATVTYIA